MAEVVDAHILALEKIIDVHSRHLDDCDIDVDVIADYWKEVARRIRGVGWNDNWRTWLCLECGAVLGEESDG